MKLHSSLSLTDWLCRRKAVSCQHPSLGHKLGLEVLRSSSFWVFGYLGRMKHLWRRVCSAVKNWSTHGFSCTLESQKSSSRSSQRSVEPSRSSPCLSALRTWSCRRKHSPSSTDTQTTISYHWCRCLWGCCCTCRCCSSAWPRLDGNQTVCRSHRCCRQSASPLSERSPARNWYLTTETSRLESVLPQRITWQKLMMKMIRLRNWLGVYSSDHFLN